MSAIEGLPGAKIEVNGTPLEGDVFSHVSRVVVQQRLEGSDTFRVEFNAGQKYWEDEDVFPLGAEVVVYMGQEDDLLPIHDGEVTAFFVEYLHKKGAKFMVRGADRSHRMHRAVRYRSIPAESDTDAVKAIASDHGLTAQADDAPYNGEVRMQFNQTDHAYIKDRARRLGWVYKVEGKDLIFRATTFVDSGKSFSVNAEVLSFDIGLELNPVPTQVKVWGWDPWKKEPVVHESKKGEEFWGPVAKSFGPDLSDKAFGENKIQVADLAVGTEDEVKEVAMGLFQRASERTVMGPILLRGDAELKVGELITLEGLGKALDGSYLIKELTHMWNRDGYFTRALVARNALEV